MIKQIFTFGSDHLGGTGLGRYVVVWGQTREQCRASMVERYGREWAFQYDSEEKAGVEKWGMTLHETIGPSAYYWRSGYELDGWADEYEVLFRADGTVVASLTEPEDRTYYRDLAPITAELNRLADSGRAGHE